MKAKEGLSMRRVAVTIGLMGMLFCSAYIQTVNAEECELPFVMNLRPNQYLFIHGERQETVSMELKTDPKELYINGILVCTERRKDKEAPVPTPPELKRFYIKVPYVVQLQNQGVDKDTAIEMCNTRVDSLMALLDPLAFRYINGLRSDDDVVERSAFILNELGYKDVCESIETYDGYLRVHLYLMATPISIGLLPPMGKGTTNRRCESFANGVCAFCNLEVEIATMYLISASGTKLLSGDGFVNGALKQIEAAERGEETEGRLHSTYIRDFKPKE